MGDVLHFPSPGDFKIGNILLIDWPVSLSWKAPSISHLVLQLACKSLILYGAILVPILQSPIEIKRK
jgi:hypothetical protein